MEKSRLFICGDSWVDWIRPHKELHWTSLLKNHYEVHKLGVMNMDNTSIIQQLGQIPPYQEGDRVIIVFTEPQRINRRYYIKDLKKLNSWLDYPLKTWAYPDEYTIDRELMETKLWDKGMRGDEIKFYQKMKELLGDYKPVFVTWSFHFHKLTKDFVDLIQVSSVTDEGIAKEDGHPGIIGSYDFYQQVLFKLDPNIKKIDFKGDKQII